MFWEWLGCGEEKVDADFCWVIVISQDLRTAYSLELDNKKYWTTASALDWLELSGGQDSLCGLPHVPPIPTVQPPLCFSCHEPLRPGYYVSPGGTWI